MSEYVDKVIVNEREVPIHDSEQRSAIDSLIPAAVTDDVGKALIVKSVSSGKVTEYEFGDVATVDITADAPATANADGLKGDVRFDQNYVYFCVADNTWKRIPLESWA